MPGAARRSTPSTFTEDGRPHDARPCWCEHSCQEHRDAHIESGMEGGMQEAMDKLEQVAISLGLAGRSDQGCRRVITGRGAGRGRP